MNGGCLNANTEPPTTPVFSSTNGNWNSGTGLFTVASGDPLAAGVAVGDFASVFNDGATAPVFVGRVTARTSTTVTVSTSIRLGTAPSTSATARSINVGGAWLGPNGTQGFPFTLMQGACINTSSNPPRVNLKNDQTYNITAVMNSPSSILGPVLFQGYTSTFGDLGKATIDGGTSGAAYILWTNNGALGFCIADLIFQNNGATGAAPLVDYLNASSIGIVLRCVFRESRQHGIRFLVGGALAIECEAYACNKNNSTFTAGFAAAGTTQMFIRCISHDHVGSNAHGFYFSGPGARAVDCISFNNGGIGYRISGNSSNIHNSDAYNNTGSGIDFALASSIGSAYIENCNLINNGGYGIDTTGSATGLYFIYNCGFGSGSEANTSGQVNSSAGDAVLEEGSITYPSGVTPWVDPVNGDFRINLSDAKNAARGAFTLIAPGYAGTVGYPDIGAVQHLDAGGGGTGISRARAFSGFA